MSDIEPKKMKVAELKEELKARGLDTKGVKAVLVKRLEQAIAQESGAGEGDNGAPEGDGDMDGSYLDTTTEEQSEADQSMSAAQAEPESAEPESEEPESAEPESAEPESAEPEAAEPEAAEPEAAEAEAAEPEAAEPEAAEPAAAEPEAVEAQQEVAPVQEQEAVEQEEPEALQQSEQPEAEEPEVVTQSEPQENEVVEAELATPECDERNLEAEGQAALVAENEAAEDAQMEKESAEDVQEDVAVKEEAKAEADMAVEPVAAAQEEPMEEAPQEEAIKEEVKEEAKPAAEDAETKEAPEDEQTPPAAGGPEPEAEYQVMDAIEDSEAPEADQKPEQKMEAEQTEVKSEKPEGDDDRRGQKRRHSRSRSRSKDRFRRSPGDRDGSRGRSRDKSSERGRSPRSSDYRSSHRGGYDRRPQEVPENEDWLQAKTVVLDRFNCDLNMRVDDDGYKGTPISVEGFAFMWAGVRANFGLKKGKKCFEIKIKSHLNVDHLPEEEKSRHVVRIGWSTDCSSTQLGEEKFSYGYGGTAKASTDCNFKDYGKTFGEGDAVMAYIDFDNDGPIVMSYSVNGEDQGTCFEVEREELGDKALFPHILSKNSEFVVNFGQMDEPMFAPKEGFTFMSNADPEDWVRGALPPAKKEDCEVIMMCGLPAAGKTVWAAKKAQEQPEKRYNVLGTNNIIDKMKVMGLPRKKNYAGRWDVLIDKATKCLTRMLEVASKKKRNYIIDQTNVYPSAQRRKMRPFEGFQRIAVVIVPTDEEYKTRREAQQKEEGKDVPDDAILEMKANFALPEEGPVFDKVEFIEQQREDAAKLVETYNKEGQAVFPPDQKRWRRDDNRFNSPGGGRDYRGRDRYDNRGGDSYRGGSYNSYSRDRGYYNSNNERRGSGGHRGGGGGGGGYNDRNRSGGWGSGGYNDRNRSYGSGGRDNRDSYRDNRNRRDDRSGGYRDYNRSGSNSASSYSNWNNKNANSTSATNSWGSQNQGWGNQNSGWGNQQGQWGQQGWGNQGYNQQGWGQQWAGYNQQAAANQGWGQQYGNYWNQQQAGATGTAQQTGTAAATAAAGQWGASSGYPATQASAWGNYGTAAAATASTAQTPSTTTSSYNYGQQK